MKHLTTLLTALVAFAAAAQQMPYNPDANGDDFVGVDDVLGVLGVYDTALMQPDLQCDYEGTDLEQLFIGLADGSLILDSAYVEYLIYDTIEYYTPGCPDLILDPVVLERSYVCHAAGGNSFVQTTHFGFDRYAQIGYYEGANTFSLYLVDQEVQVTTNYSNTSYLTTIDNVDGNCFGAEFTLPFPDDWELTEDGIEGTFCWWGGAAEHFRFIPFWHEAE